jgi:hypothetical protein
MQRRIEVVADREHPTGASEAWPRLRLNGHQANGSTGTDEHDVLTSDDRADQIRQLTLCLRNVYRGHCLSP